MTILEGMGFSIIIMIGIKNIILSISEKNLRSILGWIGSLILIIILLIKYV